MNPGAFEDPYLGRAWDSLGADIRARGDSVAVTLGYPAAGLAADLQRRLGQFLNAAVTLQLDFRAPPGRGFGQVGHLLAVASGKGGVGKSTAAVNLALALAREGAAVGLLDADIYGPSQGMMLGVAAGQRPEVSERDGSRWLVPIKSHGVKAMSMSFLADERTPMVWRGPMATGALQQLLGQTDWGRLDYLIVDMPPGTGDIQLTLSQKAPLSGAVIVTTPQDIALLDARKAIEMFAKVEVPVLGIIENMSYFACPGCGQETPVFDTGGGARVAEEYATPMLGALPLAPAIRAEADGGRPTVAASPDGANALLYRDIARHMAARIWGQNKAPAPEITMADE